METQSIAIPLNSAVSIAHHKSLVPKESLKNNKVYNRDELFRGTEQLNRESRELRRDPLVNAFLDAELALCKLMQKICRTLTEGIDLDIPEL